MAIHSSILVWEIPWLEEPGGLQFAESQKSSQGHDLTTKKTNKKKQWRYLRVIEGINTHPQPIHHAPLPILSFLKVPSSTSLSLWSSTVTSTTPRQLQDQAKNATQVQGGTARSGRRGELASCLCTLLPNRPLRSHATEDKADEGHHWIIAHKDKAALAGTQMCGSGTWSL